MLGRPIAANTAQSRRQAYVNTRPCSIRRKDAPITLQPIEPRFKKELLIGFTAPMAYICTHGFVFN